LRAKNAHRATCVSNHRKRGNNRSTDDTSKAIGHMHLDKRVVGLDMLLFVSTKLYRV